MDAFPQVDFTAAAARLDGVVKHTPLAPFLSGNPCVDLRCKLECLQVGGAFKSRGAWNQVSQLSCAAKKLGVVATSSGNHGMALAWAAQRAEIPCTICMPKNSYANKIQACRDWGATVRLAASREDAEQACADLVAEGATLVHPFDSWKTIEGAGTVGLEIAQDWPEVEVVIVPVGGGGLIAGVSLALRSVLGPSVATFGVEPEGAPTLSRGLAAGKPVHSAEITTSVQGLCPLAAGARNIQVAATCVQQVFALTDAAIYAAQARLVQEEGWTVEPAGAAAPALVLSGYLPSEWITGRSEADPLRVVAVVSGGNPDPTQMADLLAARE